MQNFNLFFCNVSMGYKYAHYVPFGFLGKIRVHDINDILSVHS